MTPTMKRATSCRDQFAATGSREADDLYATCRLTLQFSHSGSLVYAHPLGTRQGPGVRELPSPPPVVDDSVRAGFNSGMGSPWGGGIPADLSD
jgi:hypothetical protein